MSQDSPPSSKPPAKPPAAAVHAGALGVFHPGTREPLTGLCPNCGGVVRALEGEMAPGDLRSFHLGRRPAYAMHASSQCHKK